MSDIIISSLIETWRIANLTNFDFGLPDVPGLTASNALPKKKNGVPQWIDSLDYTTAELLAASVNFRNGLTSNPPSIGSEGYKHTHEGSYNVGGDLPDATNWHSHSGLDILTGSTTPNAIDNLDLKIQVEEVSVNQLSDISSDGATIEAAVAQAHARDHTLLDHINNGILLTTDGNIFLKETSEKSNVAGFGQLWCKDNKGTTELWFRGGEGINTRLA